MKKRIFSSMLLLTLISFVTISTALCIVFYRQLSITIQHDLKNWADAFSDNSSQTVILALSDVRSSDMRVTVVQPDGTVLFDNATQAELMPNHYDRAEIRDAYENGYGQSKRFSDTLHEETVYYAVKLTDDYVLRISKTSSSILGVFLETLPIVASVVMVMGIICNLLAGRLTRRIVAPINNVNFERELNAPYDEIVPFVRTIESQNKHIMQQFSDLQTRSETINTIMENMNEGIVLIDKQGVILSANKSVLRIFDKASEINGMNISGFFRDSVFTGHMRSAIEGKSGEMNMEWAGRTYRIYFSHVKDNGAIILFLDITEKAKAEKLRREFSANVSHELKTPLTSIYGNAEMLAGGMVREDDKKTFYNQIKDEAGRLITLIEDILMLSKLDENGGQESFEVIDLSAIAIEAADALSNKAVDNNITVHICGEGIKAKANRSLIYEMIYNLIDNAIKYNKPGGTVDITMNSVHGQTVITVSDTGIGIPKEAQNRVFERFYRVDKSRSRKTGGTGLWLAIVKHIAAVHNGKVELKSRENEGTEISVTF